MHKILHGEMVRFVIRQKPFVTVHHLFCHILLSLYRLCSINVYNYFPVSPIFVHSTVPTIASIPIGTRLIVLPEWNSSSEHCSELQDRDIFVACRAVSIPEPQVNILVNGNISEPFVQTGNEVVIKSAPISYGKVVMFNCQASTMTSTSNIIVNLTYTCKCAWLY